jgi:glycosyltransferase involved in cell wall biosynthesis
MISKLKVLHVTPFYHPAIQFGGPIQSVHLLNKTLKKQGVEVDVFTTNAGLEKQKEFNPQSWRVIDGVNVKYFPYYGYINYSFSPELFISLNKIVKNYNVVHITAVWNFTVAATAYVCRQAGVPYIISPRGTIYPEAIAIKSSFIKRSYLKLISYKDLNGATAIHYTSLDEKQKVESSLHLSAPGIIVPNGIDLSDYADLSRPKNFGKYYPELRGKKYILFLSRINKKKGLDILVEAFAQISASYPELTLVIAGPDNEEYGTHVKEALTKKGVIQNTFFTGLISGEVKLAAYRDAEIFILPSYSENFGMSIVEAMACGTPVIISDQVGIAQDIDQQKAGVVTTTKVESVAKAMNHLLDNKEERKCIGEKGLKMVREYYNIEAVSKEFIKEYTKHCQ